MSASEKSRFFASASIAGSDQCWMWTGTGGNGYGVIGVRLPHKTTRYAHRIAKELAIGRELTSEENIHHTCRNKLCVNPAHLLIVSRSEHKSDYDRMTHCCRGHEFTPENTYVNAKGHQVCRTCRREYQSRLRKERRLTDPEWREKQRQRMKDYHARRRDGS